MHCSMFDLLCQPALQTLLHAQLRVPDLTTATPCWPMFQRTCTGDSSYRIHWHVLSPEPVDDITLLGYLPSCIDCWFELASRSNSYANLRTSPILSRITNIYMNSGRLPSYTDFTTETARRFFCYSPTRTWKNLPH